MATEPDEKAKKKKEKEAGTSEAKTKVAEAEAALAAAKDAAGKEGEPADDVEMEKVEEAAKVAQAAIKKGEIQGMSESTAHALIERLDKVIAAQTKTEKKKLKLFPF